MTDKEIENEIMEKFDTSVSGNSSSSKGANDVPARLIWDTDKKRWEWRFLREDEVIPLGGEAISPKKNGWCWEGIHCTNTSCKFKHRNLPPIESGSSPTRTLPSSIRGPRQHRATSSAKMLNPNLSSENNSVETIQNSDVITPKLKRSLANFQKDSIDVPPGMENKDIACNPQFKEDKLNSINTMNQNIMGM